MIDTGAGLNLLKEDMIESCTPVNTLKTLRLTGINEHPVHTLGQVKIEILGYPTIFNIIPKGVPVDEDGVLGSEFFVDNNVKINYATKCLEVNESQYPFTSRNTIILPERSISDINLIIENSEIKTGYIPQLSVGQGIFLGNAFVTNNVGKAYVKIAQTEPVETQIPKVTLQEFEELTEQPFSPVTEDKLNILTPADEIFNELANFKNCSNQVKRVYSASCQNRIEQIKDLLGLQHLNSEELEHVKNLVKDHADRFHIPGERLSATPVLQHKIPTTDDVPVFTRQYRFPLVHKEEIIKQNTELLKTEIIKPS